MTKLTATRYFKVSPRGFANELFYLRAATDEEVAAIDAEFDGFEDREFDLGNTSAYCGWTRDKAAARESMTLGEWKSCY